MDYQEIAHPCELEHVELEHEELEQLDAVKEEPKFSRCESFFKSCEEITGPSPFWQEAIDVFSCPYAMFIYAVAFVDCFMKIAVSIATPFKRWSFLRFPVPVKEKFGTKFSGT